MRPPPTRSSFQVSVWSSSELVSSLQRSSNSLYVSPTVMTKNATCEYGRLMLHRMRTKITTKTLLDRTVSTSVLRSIRALHLRGRADYWHSSVTIVNMSKEHTTRGQNPPVVRIGCCNIGGDLAYGRNQSFYTASRLEIIR